MKQLSLVLLLLAFAPQPSSATEPFSVFGIPFGAPFEVPECPWRESRNYLSPDRTAKQREYTQTSYSGTDGPCFVQSLRNIGSPIPEGDNVSVLFPLKDSPSMSKRGHLTLRIVGGKTDHMTFETRGITAQELDLESLQAKFGTPDTLNRPKAQNRMGATFETVEAVWSLAGDISVTYLSATDRIDEGVVVITTPDGTQAERRALDELKKALGGRSL